MAPPFPQLYLFPHILLTSNDVMRFDRKDIIVNVRERVRLTLKHKGKLPKTITGLNFVLLSADSSPASFARIAKEATRDNFMPAEEVIAYTKLIGGGESVSIEFNAPAKGTNDFICSFPGKNHLMKGKFMVE